MNARKRRLSQRHETRREKKDKHPKNARPIVQPEPLPVLDHYTHAVQNYLAHINNVEVDNVRALVHYSKHHNRKYKSFF